jgi:hypothetical protein
MLHRLFAFAEFDCCFIRHCRIAFKMHTVIETSSYFADARAAGMTETDRDAVVTLVASNPEAGDQITGTGGARKVRIPGRGKGKTGGFRVVTFNSGSEVPVFLMAVYSKGEKANLSKAERNELKTYLKQAVEQYRRKGRRHV